MKSFIPFLHSVNDLRFLKSMDSFTSIIRVPLLSSELCGKLPAEVRLWADGCVDGLHAEVKPNSPYRQYLTQFEGSASVVNATGLTRLDIKNVKTFVRAVLDRCHKLRPLWISVPQLPVGADALRNKINKAMAEAAGDWRMDERFSGKLILPVILTHQRQTKLKASRTKIINWAARCYSLSGAQGLWVVDSSLDDSSGSETLGRTKLPKLIAFHEELLQSFGEQELVVGGPYWGMNLVLWARGLVSHAAVGLGKGYHYFLPGGVIKPGSARITLAPLRRLSVVNTELESWLLHSLSVLPSNHHARRDLVSIHKRISTYYDKDSARRQVAESYRTWIEKLSSVPPAGRALALYQDLSEAFVVGRTIGKNLPRAGSASRAPEKVAQQLLLNCL
jgi:hypothetical protein